MNQMSQKIGQLTQKPQTIERPPQYSQSYPDHTGLMTSVSRYSHELSADFMWELAVWRDRLVQWSNDVFNLGHYEAQNYELTTSANQKSKSESARVDFLDYGIDFEWFDQMDIDWLQHIFDENHDPDFARVLERIRADRNEEPTINRFNTDFIFHEPLQSTLSMKKQRASL